MPSVENKSSEGISPKHSERGDSQTVGNSTGVAKGGSGWARSTPQFHLCKKLL